MIIPCYHGRPMRKVKEYPNFILFQDVKTGVKMSFNYYELQMKESIKLSEDELKQYRRTAHKGCKVGEYQKKIEKTSDIEKIQERSSDMKTEEQIKEEISKHKAWLKENRLLKDKEKEKWLHECIIEGLEWVIK